MTWITLVTLITLTCTDIQVQRIAVVDFDIHHGNGSQELLQSDPDCLFISLHRLNVFPFTGTTQEQGSYHFPICIYVYQGY